MINYSLGLRLAEPGKENGKMEVRPYPQVHKVMDIEDLADHIQEHGSPYTADIIVGVARKLVGCIREQLLEGNRISLGRMGTFYVTFNSTGVEDVEKFNPQEHITRVRVRWERSKYFMDLKPAATFNYTVTRKAESAAKKAEKEALNNELGNSDSQGGSGTGDPGDVTP